MNQRYLISIFHLLLIFFANTTNAANPNLTNDEIKWIEGHQIIRYAIDPYWQPIEYLDGENAAGLTVAYLREISNIIGIKFKFIKTSSWSDSVNLLAEGKIDLLPGVPDFDIPKSLATHAELTTPYFVAQTVIVSNAKNRITYNLSSFSIYDTIAIKKGGAYESWLRRNYPNPRIITFETIEGALNAVLKGSATVAIGPEPILHPIIRQRYGRSLFLAGVVRDLPIALRIGTISTSPELQSIIQKTLSSISAEVSDRIQEEWVEDADFGQPSLAALMKYYGIRIGAVFFVFSLSIVALLQAWKARNAIEEVARQRAAFLSIMAHEIRNPLNYILASIELASIQASRSMMQHYINIAVRGGESLAALLSNVLDYSKMENSRIIIENYPISVTDLLSPIMPALSIEASRKGIKMSTFIAEDLASHFLLDKIKLRQILTNIISNSIKFTNYGSISLTVEREAGSLSENIVFRVTDTGIGIQRHELSKIMQPFYQIKNHGMENIGAGLGLALCHELASAMRGEISILSSVGDGTTVIIKVPLNEDPGKHIENVSPEINKNTSSASVLIVEDIEANRNIIKSQIEHLGGSPIIATSGREAIEILSHREFDLILLDCNLPDMPGYEVARCVRSFHHPNISSIPIIAISADVDEQHVVRCLESGMNESIAKPINISKLQEVLSCWTDRKRDRVKLSDLKPPAESDENVWAALRAEAVEVLRCSLKKDVDGVEFHSHRLRGISLSFEYDNLLKIIPYDFNLNSDRREICKNMIFLIRQLDSGALQKSQE